MRDALWIVRGGALGDVFVLAPALAALRVARPASHLIGWGRASALQVLCDAGLLDEVYDFEGTRGYTAFDHDASASPWTADRFRDASGCLSFGFGALRRDLEASLGFQTTTRAPFPRESGLPVWRYLHASCAQAFGPLPEPPAAPLQRLRRDIPQATIWIQPGSGSRTKNWPLDRFLALAHQLTQRGEHCVFALGEAEDEAWERTLQQAGMSVQRPTLAAIVRELAAARLWIGNDSGLTHLAALIGVPTLALFQASDECAWHPFGLRVRALGARGEPAASEEALAAALELLSPIQES